MADELERVPEYNLNKQITRKPNQKQKTYTVDHKEAMPNEGMIQTIMNMKTLSTEFKMQCLQAFTERNYKFIERRIIKNSGPEERKTAEEMVNFLRDQIKRDKKYYKQLQRG